MAGEQGFYNLPRFIGKNYPETDQLVCLTIYIPEGVEYQAQLLALMNLAGTKAAWWTDNDAQRYARADIWQKAYRETLEAIMSGCFDCDDVADCIETSDATRAALLQFTNSTFNENQTGTGEIPDTLKVENLLNQSDCDPDKAWGNALNIVQSLNRRNLDFLETVAAATNNQEAVSFIVGAIPVLETLPIDEMVVIANKVQAWIKESYEAGYDLDYELERACDIFCLIVSAENCELTFEQLRDFYWAKAQSLAIFENAFESAIEIIEAWANWDETFGEIVVDVMCAMQFGFMNFLNSGFGFAFKQFKVQSNAGIPDDDWAVNCDDCPAIWQHTIMLEDEDGSFLVVSSAAKYTATEGWGVNSPTNTNTIAIQRTLPAAEYTSIEFEADVAPAYVSLIQVRSANYPSGTTLNQQRNEPGTAITKIVGTWTNPPSVFVNYSKTASTTLSGYTGKLKRVTFTGTGDNPFI